MISVLIFSFLGLILGLFCTWMFCSQDIGFFKGLLPIGSNIGIFIGFKKIAEILGTTDDIFPVCVLFYFLLLIVTLAISLKHIAKNLKNSGEMGFHFSFIDILFGQKKLIEIHLDNRKKLLDSKLNITELEKREDSLCKMEATFAKKEKHVNSLYSKMLKSSEGLKFNFPNGKTYPITQDFINKLINFQKDLDFALSDIRRNMQSYVNTIVENENLLLGLNAFFNHLSVSLCSYLFNSRDTTVRIHFRKQSTDNDLIIYKKIIASCSESNSFIKENLTDIPYKNSLIFWSWTYKHSLIASLYLEDSNYVFKANNHNMWEDFMTITFPELQKDGKPLITMGISTKDKHGHLDLFLYLSHIKFEVIIQKLISEFYASINKNTIFKISDIDNILMEEKIA